MTVEFQQEYPASSIYEEALPLFKRHYDEIAKYKDIPLEVDVDAYARIEAAGGLRCYSAREGDRLVGYVIFFVKQHPHYASTLFAAQDVLYLDPDYRKGMTGLRLIRYADRQLEADGVQVVTQHVKTYADFGPILERMGYEKVETVYMRRLGTGHT